MTNCTKNFNLALMPTTKAACFMLFMLLSKLSLVTVSAKRNNFNVKVTANRKVRVTDSDHDRQQLETTESTLKTSFSEYPGFQLRRTQTNHVRTRRTVQNVAPKSSFLGSGGNDAGRIFNFIRELRNNEIRIEPNFEDFMNIKFKVTRTKRVKHIIYTEE